MFHFLTVYRFGTFGAKYSAGGAGEVPRGMAEALQRSVSFTDEQDVLF